MYIPEDETTDPVSFYGSTQNALDDSVQKERDLLERKHFANNLRERLLGSSDRSAELGSDLALGAALQKSAAQIGSYNGQVADTSSVDEFRKNIMESNKARLARDADMYDTEARGVVDIQDQLMRKKQRDDTNELSAARIVERSGPDPIAEARKALLEAQTGKVLEETKQVGKPKPQTHSVSGGKTVPAGQVTEMADIASVDKMINDLETSYKAGASAGGSGISQYRPDSPANLYRVRRDSAVNIIAKSIEGRAPTDMDMVRYNKMVPSASDTNAQAQVKFQILRDYAKDKLQSRQSGLSATGYNTGMAPQETPKVKMTNGTETRMIKADKKSAAEAAGWREVK